MWEGPCKRSLAANGKCSRVPLTLQVSYQMFDIQLISVLQTRQTLTFPSPSLFFSSVSTVNSINGEVVFLNRHYLEVFFFFFLSIKGRWINNKIKLE